jgi:uncharacterized membrane protein
MAFPVSVSYNGHKPLLLCLPPATLLLSAPNSEQFWEVIMAFCAYCGTQMADSAAFCPNCGKAAGQASGGGASVAPPTPAPPASYGNTSAPAAPIAENVAGMLAYFTIIPAIIFLLLEPYNRNRFVRFHSFQCLFIAAALIVLHILLSIISYTLPLMMFPIWGLLGLAELALWLLLVIKAYQHEMFKLPIVGDLAEKQANA